MSGLWIYLRRTGHFCWVLTRHALGRGGRRLLRRLPWLGRRVAPPVPGPVRLRLLLEELGGTFIKFGQVLALQPDVLPPEYCDELFDLMDRVQPCDPAEVEAVFEADLGRSPQKIFESFEREPMASASIGQVHEARLGGLRLAVKVQRPTALRDFGADLRLMAAAANWIRRLRLKNLEWITVPMGDFVTWTREELDYRTEARFMDRLGSNARGLTREKVPEVLWDLTTRRVLTAELLEGPTLLEYIRAVQASDDPLLLRLEDLGFDPETFAENVLKNFLDDVLEHGVFHADLHPANLLILRDNAVGYVDFGITGVMSRHSRYHMMEAIVALARGDLTSLSRALLEISEVGARSDVEGFKQGLRDQAEGWLERRDGRLRMRTSYSVFCAELLQLTRRTRLYPHAEVVRYIRSVITCDGLLRRFAPGVDIDLLLEEHSARLLGAKSLARTLSVENMVDWWAASSSLLKDGASRLDLLLARSAVDDEASSAGSFRSSSATSPRHERGLLQTALVLVTLVLLMVVYDEPVQPGLNLFTAEAALIVAGLLVFLGRVFRWLTSSH